VQQIAIGGTDKGKLRALWGDVFGLEYVKVGSLIAAAAAAAAAARR
jgi:hypothetical protein